MKRVEILMVLAGIVAVAAMGWYLISPAPSDFRAYGRFIVSEGSYFTNATYDPHFFSNQFEIISNTLSSADSIKGLAEISGVEASDFRLNRVIGIRGTRIMGMEYGGRDADKVERVASNATRLVLAFFATNRPAYELKFVDPLVIHPEPRWKKILDR
jgi:hypothetical protein